MALPDDSPGRAPDSSEPQLGLIVVAAGESLRMGGMDKIFTSLMGVPLIAHSVEALTASPLVHSFVLVLSRRNVEAGKRLADERGWPKLAAVIEGGARRQDSVKLGLEMLPPLPWVAVHDGARPYPGCQILERGLEAARETGASIAAVRAKDTIKVVSESGVVEATPPRSRLWLVQTPQVFRFDLLMRAHDACTDNFTDDAAMVESLGHQVRVFEGAYTNLKVTTPEDLSMVEAALRASADANLSRTIPRATST